MIILLLDSLLNLRVCKLVEGLGKSFIEFMDFGLLMLVVLECNNNEYFLVMWLGMWGY